MFDLKAGLRFEELKRWREANQAYLQAGRTDLAPVQKEAMEGLKRLERYFPADDVEGFEFDLALSYEKEGDWKAAESHYAAAGRDTFGKRRAAALEGVRRAYDHQWLDHLVDDFDRFLGYIARALAALLIPVIVYKLWKFWRAVECMPFEASNEEASARIHFFLRQARDDLPNLLASASWSQRTSVVDALPLMLLPGTEDSLPVEDLEIGEVKIPLGDWIKVIKRPRVRIVGRWNVGSTIGTAHARILRRRWFICFREAEICRASIPSPAGEAQDLELTLFACDVIVKTVFAYHAV